MKCKKLVSIFLVVAMMLSILASCSSSESKSAVNAEDEETGTALIEVNPQLVEKEVVEPKKTVAELGQFYSLDATNIKCDSNVYDYFYSSPYSRCLYDDCLIFTENFNATTNDIDYDSRNELSVYNFSNGNCTTFTLDKHAYYNYAELIPFVYNDVLYLYEINYSADEPYTCYAVSLVYDNNGDVIDILLDPVTESKGIDASPVSLDPETNLLSFNSDYYVYCLVRFSDGIVISGDTADISFLGYLNENGTFSFINQEEYLWYSDVIPYGDSLLVFDAYNYVAYDKEDLTKQEPADVDVSYISSNNVLAAADKDGLYINSYEGFYFLDYKNDTAETIIDYNCLIGENIGKFVDSSFIKEDNGIFYFMDYTFDYLRKDVYCTLYTVSPIDTPNEDKTVITMACDNLDSMIVDAVHHYNYLNNDFFVEYRLIDGSVPNGYGTVKCNASELYYYAGDAASYYNHTKYRAQVESMEYSIISEGKFDLLYGFEDYGLFNSDRVCFDLNKNKDIWNNKNLYNNVIEAKQNDEKQLFQIPLNFTLELIAIEDFVSKESMPNTCHIRTLTLNDFNGLIDEYGTDPLHDYVSDYECFTQMLEFNFKDLIDVNNQSTKFDTDGMEDLFDFAMKDVADWRIKKSEIQEVEGEDVLVESALNEDFSQDFYYEEGEYPSIRLAYTLANSVYDYIPIDGIAPIYNSFSVPTLMENQCVAHAYNTISVYKDTSYVFECMDFVRYLLSDSVSYLDEMFGFAINSEVNRHRQYDMLNTIDSYFDIGFSDEADLIMANIEDSISCINSFTGKDWIIETVILQSMIDYSRSGSQVTTNQAIDAIEQAVQSVLNRY